MPRFFFHYRDGDKAAVDTEGMNSLAKPKCARRDDLG